MIVFLSWIDSHHKAAKQSFLRGQLAWGEGKELLIVDGFFLLHRHDTSEAYDTLIS